MPQAGVVVHVTDKLYDFINYKEAFDNFDIHTRLNGLQSSSASRWCIFASVRSFFDGLYSNSCMSMFHVDESS